MMKKVRKDKQGGTMNKTKEIADKYGAVNEEDNLTEEEKKEIEKNAEVISFLPIFTELTVK